MLKEGLDKKMVSLTVYFTSVRQTVPNTRDKVENLSLIHI